MGRELFSVSKIWGSTERQVEPTNPVKMPSPSGSGILDRKAQRVGLMLVEKMLRRLAPQGSAGCSPTMHVIDSSLSDPSDAISVAPLADALAEDARLIMRARCASCPRRCAKPLL